MAELGGLNANSGDPQLARARVGRAALDATALASETELRASIVARCPSRRWPEQRLLLSAVDAETGEFVTLHDESGKELIDAVVASCALPFAYPLATAMGRRWIDGFIRSPVNVDLATGYPRIVVLAPMVDGFGPTGRVPTRSASCHSARVRILPWSSLTPPSMP
ncbi:putative acylesterase/phospholipase RssA [Streptomyces sp. V1I1]|nr:putative acylesterase/phospholipase RssA [Streptomyces sp. V1I1]